MGIQFIDNQPIIFIDNEDNGGECLLGQQTYCTKYNKGDHIYAQWKITPCLNANLICNPDFVNNEAEYVLDPYMINGTDDWSDNAGVWSYDSTNSRWQANGSSGQQLSSLRGNQSGALSGYAYEVTFTIGGNTGGTINVDLGGTLGNIVFAAGTYKQILVFGSLHTEIRFDTVNFDGWVDNVSIKETILSSTLQGCWASSDYPERWSITNEGCLSKVKGQADILINNFYGYSAGMYVKVSVNVSNSTGGILNITNNSQTVLSISSNGYHETYFNANSPLLKFEADALFDGTLCDISLISYEQTISANLISTSGGPTYNLTSALSYYEDRLLLDRLVLGTWQTGCYTLCLTYECGQYYESDLCSNDFENDLYGSKESIGTIVESLDNGQYVVDLYGEPSVLYYLSCPEACLENQDFYVINWSITTGNIWTVDCYLTIEFPGCSTFPLFNGGAPNTTYSGQFILNCQPSECGWQINVYAPYTQSGDRISFDDVSLSYLFNEEQSSIDFCSNCINIEDDEPCSLFIGGFCGEDSFGFKFPQGQPFPWRIGARVRAVVINPKYNGELKRYSDSEGNIKVTKALSNKKSTVLIDYVDEKSHDWLRTAFLCDTIELGRYMFPEQYYVGTDGDYEPEWPSNLGNFNLAQARVDIQKKKDTIFNNNAG